MTPPDRIVVEDRGDGRAQALVVNEDTALDLPAAKVSLGREIAGQRSLDLEFAPDVAHQLFALTAGHIGYHMVVMSGDRVLASPTIRSAFGEHVQVTFGTTAHPGEAEELAASLRESLHPPALNPPSPLTPTFSPATGER